MWCKNCNIETNEDRCNICGNETCEALPTEIFWCDKCKTPLIQLINQVDKGFCTICGEHMEYMSADLRPVFPEERLLLELLLGRRPNEFLSQSVWASKNRYTRAICIF